MSEYELMKERVEEEEKQLIFTTFNAEKALIIGQALIEEAKRRNNKICIDITAFGRCLFHFSGTGNAPSNDELVRRKRNTAFYTGHSSLWVHYFLKDLAMSIEEKWHLKGADYAEVGGAFPVRLINGDGVIGVITVSGFPHETDHEMITTVIPDYL